MPGSGRQWQRRSQPPCKGVSRSWGNSLVMAMIIMASTTVIAGSYLSVVVVQRERVLAGTLGFCCDQTADSMFAMAMAKLDRHLYETDSLSTSYVGYVTDDISDRTNWCFNYRRNTTDANLWKVTVAATSESGSIYRVSQSIVSVPALASTVKGALNSYYGTLLMDNPKVDGNAYNYYGSAGYSADNTYAIAIKNGTATWSGVNGQLGGWGAALAHSIDANTLDATYGGAVYPTTPLAALGLSELPAGALTFASAAAFQAWYNALPAGKPCPDNSYLNLTFQNHDEQVQVKNLFQGIAWGATAHIVVWHYEDAGVNADPNAPKGNAAGFASYIGDASNIFKGIAILDQTELLGNGGYIRGAVFSLSGDDVGEETGMDSVTIEFCPAAIRAALRQAAGVKGPAPSIVSYRGFVFDDEANAALQACGVSLPGTPEDTSADWQPPTWTGGGEPAPALAHDVAVTSVVAPEQAELNDTFAVTVNVVNNGTNDESPTVSLAYSAGTSDQVVFVAAGASAAVGFVATVTTMGDETFTGTASIDDDDAPGNNSEAATTAVIDPTMHVSSIAYSLGGHNNHDIIVDVTVINASNQPVASASVSITLYRNGTLKETGLGTTDANGVARFAVFSPASGTYTTTIDDVVGANSEAYNAAANAADPGYTK